MISFLTIKKNGETVSNPGGNMGLIEADKFTHTLFSGIKCTTDNIKNIYRRQRGCIYSFLVHVVW